MDVTHLRNVIQILHVRSNQPLLAFSSFSSKAKFATIVFMFYM